MKVKKSKKPTQSKAKGDNKTPTPSCNRAAFAEFLRHMRQTARLTAESMAYKLSCPKRDYLNYERGAILPPDPYKFEWQVRALVKEIIANNRASILEDLRIEHEANEQDANRRARARIAEQRYRDTAVAKKLP